MVLWMGSSGRLFRIMLYCHRHFEKEKEEALRKQWEEAERQKQAAIQEACTALHKQLRDEFAWEKERAIAEALALARVGTHTLQISHVMGSCEFVMIVFVYCAIAEKVQDS